MTQKEELEAVFDLLSLVSHQNWRIVGSLIRNEVGECPICALASYVGCNWKGNTSDAWNTSLGLSDDAVQKIVCAADFENGKKYRRQLKKALGL